MTVCHMKPWSFQRLLILYLIASRPVSDDEPIYGILIAAEAAVHFLDGKTFEVCLPVDRVKVLYALIFLDGLSFSYMQIN